MSKCSTNGLMGAPVTGKPVTECQNLGEVFEAALPAFQAQIEEDFKPVWGFGADLHFVPKGGTPTKGHWWMGVSIAPIKRARSGTTT